jgi:CheY-like chemotaxis protein/two-component sensor histidine kinase
MGSNRHDGRAGREAPDSEHSQLARRAMAGELAAGVTHEIANALSAIIGWSQLARRDGARAEEALALIEASATIARASARRLLGAARGTATEAPETLDVSEALEQVAAILRCDATQRRVDISVRGGRGLLVVGAPTDLLSIIWNLAKNAVEAAGPTGRVTLAASARAGKIRILVSDDGCGMDRDQKARAFDPFYTTKETGTGLGLSLVRDAVTALSGAISVDSAPGRGTQFRVDLPRAPASASRPPPATNQSGVRSRPSSSARVLVVENDDAVRELIATTLELHGARVTAVATAREARATREPFDLALVDLGLDDAHGDALLAELRMASRVRRGILVTGASVLPDAPATARPDGWLRKPFDLDDLIALLADVPDRGARTA